MKTSKPLILLFFVSLFVVNANSQDFVSSFEDDFNTYILESTKLTNNDIVLIGLFYDYDTPDWGNKIMIKRLDTLGNILHEQTLPELEHSATLVIYDLAALNDGGYAFISSSGECGSYNGNIFRFDANNQLTYFDGHSVLSPFGLYDEIEVLENGNYALIRSGGRATVYNNENEVIYDTQFSGAEIEKTIQISADEIMNLDTAGNLKVYNIYTGIESQDINLSLEDEFSIFKLSPISNSFYAQSSNSGNNRFFKNYEEEVFIFDDFANSRISASPEGEILFWKEIDDGVYSSTIFSPDWQLISNNVYDGLPLNYIITSLKLTNTSIILTGWEYNSRGQRTGFIHKLSRFQQEVNPIPDLKVVSIDFDRPVLTTVTGNPQGSDYQESHIFKNIEVVVKNVGQISVDQFSLNSTFEQIEQAECFTHFNYQSFYDDVILEPNDSMTIYIEEIEGFSVNEDSYLCIWTNSPNQKPDINNSDDRKCYGFNREYLTTSSNSGIRNIGSLVYPNPADNLIYINEPLPAGIIFKYEINDLKGVLFQSGEILQDNQINISRLPKGLFLLSVEYENERKLFKFFKN